MKNGTLAAFTAYVLWGVLPIYWKALSNVPSQEMLSHRVFWSLAFAAFLLSTQRRWGWLAEAFKKRGRLWPLCGTAALLGLNWFTYIWAINHGHIVESSLGYFINPLVNVLLGVLFLRERLRPWQWAAIGLAASGVLYLTVNYGQLPWVALLLALTFGFYGLIRKTTSLGPVEGLTVETGLLAVPALAYLVYLGGTGAGSFGRAPVATHVLLILAGAVTAVPLILFSYGARLVTLTTLGVLQYIAPTLQFLIGVLVYRESFTPARLVGFCIIWAALLVYTFEGIVFRRRHQPALPVGAH